MLQFVSEIPDNLRSWAEIDLGALQHNLDYARRIAAPQQELMAILKADAYGHGQVEVAKALDSEQLPYFGLANAAEAKRLDAAGIRTPLFLLGPTFPAERESIVAGGFTPCLCDLQEARHFSELATRLDKTLKTHLALDTGMGRGGFLPKQWRRLVDEMPQLPGLDIIGVGSHLSSADEDPDFTRQQIESFENQVAELRQHFSLRFIHLSNSAGLLAYPAGSCQLARPGLMLYGLSPIPGHQEALRPVMTLKSRVSTVRDMPAGASISYGHSFTSETPFRSATIGIGYGDGYPRALSNQGTEVLIRGERCPLLGRVTMDQIVVDVTHLDEVLPGDEVELFGPRLLVSELADKAGTIAWEILTGITPRVKRLFL